MVLGFLLIKYVLLLPYIEIPANMITITATDMAAFNCIFDKYEMSLKLYSILSLVRLVL